jgi:hypothetical protein
VTYSGNFSITTDNASHNLTFFTADNAGNNERRLDGGT